MGPRKTLVEGHLGWFYGMAGIYLSGTFLYARRIPERWLPGKLDLLGHSYQLFHVAVVMAAFSHLVGIERIVGGLRTCEAA